MAAVCVAAVDSCNTLLLLLVPNCPIVTSLISGGLIEKPS